MNRAARLILAVVAAVAAAGGCAGRRPDQPQPTGYLRDADKTIEYYLPRSRHATESRADGVHKLNFGHHSMVFEKSRIELDGTTLWARGYRNVILSGKPGGELFLNVDGQPVPTNVRLD